MPDIYLAVLGIIAAGLNIIGLWPYLRDIFRGTTKPERAMWWIYAFLSALLFVAQAKTDAGWLLVVTGAYVVSTSVIAVLSLRYGYGSFHRRDAISIVLAAIGLAAWWLSKDPMLAILMVVIVDFIGFWLTLIKTWHAPHSETLVSWQISLVAAFVSIFSAGVWSFAVLIYPVYAVLAAALIVWLIMHRRARVVEDLVDF